MDSMVSDCWAKAGARETIATKARRRKRKNRGARQPVRPEPGLLIRLFFTVLKPSGEHKCWCGTWFAFMIGFTGRISTPSITEKSDPASRKY
jgi:hypothetical protein